MVELGSILALRCIDLVVSSTLAYIEDEKELNTNLHS